MLRQSFLFPMGGGVTCMLIFWYLIRFVKENPSKFTGFSHMLFTCFWRFPESQYLLDLAICCYTCFRKFLESQSVLCSKWYMYWIYYYVKQRTGILLNIPDALMSTRIVSTIYSRGDFPTIVLCTDTIVMSQLFTSCS